RRQARASDQQLLPQPRRGHLRGVPAPDGRHRLQELPDDRARGSRERQGGLPISGMTPPAIPLPAPHGAVPRIRLGVCGGLAAYKALEFTRLATKAGHSVRVVATESATHFVGTASFAGITGAPVLIGEFETDPLRGAFPGDPPPAHAPLSHL